MAKLRNVELTEIAAAIEELDPEHRFVQLDIQNRTVAYADEFQRGQAIYSYEGEEEPVRAYIVCWLCTLGGYLPGNIELEKRYSIGRPKGGEGARLDVLVKRPDGVPYALIEVKAPAGEGSSDRYPPATNCGTTSLGGTIFKRGSSAMACRKAWRTSRGLGLSVAWM
jgi:hypothetical protein